MPGEQKTPTKTKNLLLLFMKRHLWETAQASGPDLVIALVPLSQYKKQKLDQFLKSVLRLAWVSIRWAQISEVPSSHRLQMKLWELSTTGKKTTKNKHQALQKLDQLFISTGPSWWRIFAITVKVKYQSI
ncbi:hypothetical protein KIL84_009945 [Mauremys mutica]|uniref:Uncharacterized protein n=1 Tax=Mauremys mutica TaxID=74926 RepID=A0A9D4B690_9SAUR|nr:hypothetical protein KIL84_009945 [Mauremys mutica]